MINVEAMFGVAKDGIFYLTPAFVALVLWRLNSVERSIRELRAMFFEFLKNQRKK